MAPTKESIPPIEILRATVDHVDVVASLYNMYRVYYGCADDLPAARKFIEDRTIHNESVVFVAKDPLVTDRGAGFTQLYPSFSSIRLYRTWILNDLFVHPDFRRCGIGRALMNTAAIFARESGARRIDLETRVENTSAQSLYESLGYERGEGFYTFSLSL